MEKLKYKDKDGFWQELPVGTNVVANPMLTGTEQELTSLKVGDTKYKMPAGGGEKVSITVPQGATNGTITDEQLVKLQENDLNYIEMVNDKELYYLNDTGHEEGFLTYSHVGIEKNKATIKTLTITVSAKSFVIVTTVVPTDAGGKLYRHDIVYRVFKESEGVPDDFSFSLYSMTDTLYTINNIYNDLVILTNTLICRYYSRVGGLKVPAVLTDVAAAEVRATFKYWNGSAYVDYDSTTAARIAIEDRVVEV